MSREIFHTLATYNICSDRLKVWFKTADRLPRPEYLRAKSIGFVWWPGSNCLTCTWRPEAEDFIKAHGIEIEEDDTPDDTEARVDRFSVYAANAEESASNAAERLDSGAANTERRRRFALARAENEADRAGYWNRRIEAAIHHAAFKERPDVIARRIEVLETDLRRHVASYTPHTDKAGNVTRYGTGVIVGPKGGRGGHYVEEASLPARQAAAARWVEHIEARLLYEQAALAASGGAQADLASAGGENLIEVGGAIQANHWSCSRAVWVEVVKVNPKTILCYSPAAHYKWPMIDRTRVTEIASKLRVDAGEIPLTERAPKISLRREVKKETSRDGTRPEKFGACGSSSTFYDDKTKPVERWWLITKVNAKTIEYLNAHTEEILQADGTKRTRRVFYVKKDDIRTAGRFIDAATVKAEHPHLLQEFADLEAARARKAAAQAQAAQPQTVAA